MIRSNTDCPYCHDIFDQYCNLFKGYKNCAKSDCEVLKILKENEQLKENIENARKKLFDILADYEIGNYDNNIHQFYEDVYDIHNKLMELAE